jgi:hypothetical protein
MPPSFGSVIALFMKMSQLRMMLLILRGLWYVLLTFGKLMSTCWTESSFSLLTKTYMHIHVCMV